LDLSKGTTVIIVNTGNGKGKTTSAMGQVLRSLGQGLKVCIMQLFKCESFYGEQKILLKLNNLDFFPFASKHPKCFKSVNFDEVANQCNQAMKKIGEFSNTPKKYDIIVLDEFNIAIRDNFIDGNEFIHLIKSLSKKSTLIITGRGASKALIDTADLVTEMKEIKHPYKKGIKAKKGVEF
jgi:cob(I)alamin adenosyltransferase